MKLRWALIGPLVIAAAPVVWQQEVAVGPDLKIGDAGKVRLFRTAAAPTPPPTPDYYVDATGGDNGNTGTSPEDAWQTNTKVNGFDFANGDVIAYKRGEDFTAVQLKPGDEGAEGAPLTFTAYGAGAPPLIWAYTNGKDYLTFDGLHFYAGDDVDIWTSVGLVFVNSIFANRLWSGSGPNGVTVDHCVFWRLGGYALVVNGDWVVKNTLFGPNYNTTQGPWTVPVGSTLSVSNSAIIMPQTPDDTRVTYGGGNLWYIDPKLTAYPTSVQPHCSITIDDTANLDSFNDLVDDALDTYSVKATIFVSPGEMDGGDEALASTLSGEGHEIANHAYGHTSLTAATVYSVSSTNTNPTIDIDVATTTVTLWCDEAGNRVTHDWSSDGELVSDLITSASGKGWTIVAPGSFVNVHLRGAEDTGGAQSVPYDATPDVTTPDYRFWDAAIEDAQDAIQAITSVRPITFAYPYGQANASAMAWIRDNSTLTAARGLGGPWPNLASVSKWYMFNKAADWSDSAAESVVRQWARRMYFGAITTPNHWVYYDHASSAAEITRWGWFIDEIQDLGGTFTTYGALVTWIASDHSDDGDYWTKTYTFSPNYLPATGSPLINAGSSGRQWDILGNPVKGQPDIGAYEVQ